MKEQKAATRTGETVTISRAEYEGRKSQNEWLMEQLRLVRKKQFGGSSEQTTGETLVLIPAKAVLRRDVYYTYACERCQKNDITTPIAKAPKEPAVIPGGFASPEAIAHIMTQKFVMAAPLYRQEQEWARQGLKLSRQTMSNWVLRAAEDWLSPVHEELHRQLVKRDVLHADETTLQVLREPGKKAQAKSYMWLYETGRDGGVPIVLYEYQPSRKAEHAAA